MSAVWRAVSRHDDGVGVVRLEGELDLSVVNELEDELQQALQNAATGLHVDVADVTYIDSSSVGAIMRTFAVALNEGKTLRVVNARGIPRRVLELAGVSDILGLDGTE